MARVKFSALMPEITGSIGGTTFQKNAYGFTIKNKNFRSNSGTLKQTAMKQNIVAVQSLWSGLSIVSRESWNSYAKSYPLFSNHNTSSQLSGFAVFLKRNLIAFMDIATRLSIPQSLVTINTAFAPTVSRSGASLTITPHPSSSTTQLVTILYMSAPLSLSSVIRRSGYKALFSVTNFSGAGGIAANYLSQFPVLPNAGQKVGIIFRNFGLNTGAVFAEQKYDVVVT